MEIALDLESQKGTTVVALDLGEDELMWVLIAFIYEEVRC